MLFFFFQAEDGIRDKLVTGVQTCALPILRDAVPIPPQFTQDRVTADDLLIGGECVRHRSDRAPTAVRAPVAYCSCPGLPRIERQSLEKRRNHGQWPPQRLDGLLEAVLDFDRLSRLQGDPRDELGGRAGAPLDRMGTRG